MRMAMDLIIYNKVGRNSWKFLLSDHYCPYDWEAKSDLDYMGERGGLRVQEGNGL